jgi:hypothetical protein
VRIALATSSEGASGDAHRPIARGVSGKCVALSEPIH